MAKYGSQITMYEHMPEMNWATMGSVSYTAHAYSEEEVREFMDFVQTRKENA